MELDTERIGTREEEPSYHWKQYIHGRLCRVEDEDKRLSKVVAKMATENYLLQEGVKELRIRVDTAAKKFTELQKKHEEARVKYEAEVSAKLSQLEQVIRLQDEVIESIKAGQGDLVE